jgi:hypothetical protein
MARSRLDFGGFCVEVVCDDASDLRWLAAFLACGFEEAPEASAAARVTLAVDAEAYDRLERTLCACGPGGRRLAAGFVGDTRDVEFEQLPAPGPGRLYRDRRKAILYRVADDLAAVAVLARAREARALRRALMRVRPLERGIADRIACFDCQLGGGAPPDARHARQLLESLRAPGPSAAEPEVLHV